MLARKRSLVSCSVAWAGSRTFSFQRLARIEATAGLQTSQPCPRPCEAIRASNVLISLDHRDLIELLAAVREVLAEPIVDPAARRLEFRLEQVGDAGRQPPQPVPACVQVLTCATVVSFLSRTASRICALADVVARTDLGVAIAAAGGAAAPPTGARRAGPSAASRS